MRCVFDTNVLVSALLLSNSIPRWALDLALQKGKVLLSLAVLAELNDVLTRKRFRRYVEEEDIRLFLAALTHKAELVDVDVLITACPDPKDNKFLEVGVSGRAAYIVTGDSDLLGLNPFRGIQILSPHSFLETQLRADR